MSSFYINTEQSLHNVIGEMRLLYKKTGKLEGRYEAVNKRSLDQNALSHAWYSQISLELREDDSNGWRRYCKLHHGIPILRMDDEKFREFYDAGLKVLSYEQKLAAMDFVPVTSLMSKKQLSTYLELVQADFMKRGVQLEFPESEE